MTGPVTSATPSSGLEGRAWDVYSTAMLLYTMWHGAQPFDGLNPFQVADAVRQGMRPPWPGRGRKPGAGGAGGAREFAGGPGCLRGPAPAALVALVEAMWRQDPRRRPTAAEALETFATKVAPAVLAAWPPVTPPLLSASAASAASAATAAKTPRDAQGPSAVAKPGAKRVASPTRRASARASDGDLAAAAAEATTKAYAKRVGGGDAVLGAGGVEPSRRVATERAAKARDDAAMQRSYADPAMQKSYADLVKSTTAAAQREVLAKQRVTAPSPSSPPRPAPAVPPAVPPAAAQPKGASKRTLSPVARLRRRNADAARADARADTRADVSPPLLSPVATPELVPVPFVPSFETEPPAASSSSLPLPPPPSEPAAVAKPPTPSLLRRRRAKADVVDSAGDIGGVLAAAALGPASGSAPAFGGRALLSRSQSAATPSSPSLAASSLSLSVGAAALLAKPPPTAEQDSAARTPPEDLVGMVLSVETLGLCRVRCFLRVRQRDRFAMDSLHSVELLRPKSAKKNRLPAGASASTSDDPPFEVTVRGTVYEASGAPQPVLLRRRKLGAWNIGLAFTVAWDGGGEPAGAGRSDTSPSPIRRLDAGRSVSVSGSVSAAGSMLRERVASTVVAVTKRKGEPRGGGPWLASPHGLSHSVASSAPATHKSGPQSPDGSIGDEISRKSTGGLPRTVRCGWLRLVRTNPTAWEDLAARASAHTSAQQAAVSVRRFFVLAAVLPPSVSTSEDTKGGGGGGGGGCGGNDEPSAGHPCVARFMYSKREGKPPKIDPTHCVEFFAPEMTRAGDVPGRTARKHRAASENSPGKQGMQQGTAKQGAPEVTVSCDPLDESRFSVGPWSLVAADKAEAAAWVADLRAAASGNAKKPATPQ